LQDESWIRLSSREGICRCQEREDFVSLFESDGATINNYKSFAFKFSIFYLLFILKQTKNNAQNLIIQLIYKPFYFTVSVYSSAQFKLRLNHLSYL